MLLHLVTRLATDKLLHRHPRLTLTHELFSSYPIQNVAESTFGLGATLHSALTLKEGQVQESNYHDYRVLRMHEMPKIEVHIVPSTDRMGGVGEPGTPPIAPAVANAVFALTGGDLTHTTGLHVPVDAGVAAAFLR